jgi:hypothetical protein
MTAGSGQQQLNPLTNWTGNHSEVSVALLATITKQ